MFLEILACSTSLVPALPDKTQEQAERRKETQQTRSRRRSSSLRSERIISPLVALPNHDGQARGNHKPFLVTHDRLELSRTRMTLSERSRTESDVPDVPGSGGDCGEKAFEQWPDPTNTCNSVREVKELIVRALGS